MNTPVRILEQIRVVIQLVNAGRAETRAAHYH